MSYIRSFFIILLTLGTFLIAYFSQQNEMLKDLTLSCNTVRTQLSQHVQLSSSFVDQMSLIGEEYFQNGTAHSSPLRQMIQESPSEDSFNMDAVSQTELTDSVGNLTGIGRLNASPGQMENVELALLYNPHFKAFYDNLPGIAWVYYTGVEGFMNIYPWIPSADFQFSPSLFDKPFYRPGIPALNPNRTRYWTPVYLDAAGKGLMVTISKPVYDGADFRGIISLDFTLETLSALMDPQFQSVVINVDNQVLAGTHGSAQLREKIVTLEEYAGPEKSKKLSWSAASPRDVLTSAGGYHVYATAIDGSPWTLIYILPQWEVVLKSFLFGFPVLLIGILLLLSNHAYERRREDEKVLKATVQDLEESRRQLESVASVDFLTGALNRRSMTARLQEEISRSDRYGEGFSLVMGDLDHFKDFNDRYGHAAGDMVLEQVVHVMKAHIRSADLLSRWGGEEFLLMLPDTSSVDAKAASEKLREAIESLSLEWDGIKGLKITMTFGVAEFDPVKGLDHSIIQADDALYHAKVTGRNRVCAFEDMV